MAAPPFTIKTTLEFDTQLARIARDDAGKHRKVLKTIRILRDLGPAYPSLHSHKYQSLTGPNNEDIWESYVENQTPGAWRLFWCYARHPDVIILITVGPHP